MARKRKKSTLKQLKSLGVPTAASSTAQDRKWKAESDARALIEAEEIRNDKRRLAAAKAEVRRQQQAASAALK